MSGAGGGAATGPAADSRAGVMPGWLQRLLTGPVAYRGGVPVLPGAVPLLGHFPGLSVRSAELLMHARRRLGPLYYLHLGPTVGWYRATARSSPSAGWSSGWQASSNHERASPPTSSLVSVLAHARDEARAPLGLTKLVENLRLLILAGHKTTASQHPHHAPGGQVLPAGRALDLLSPAPPKRPHGGRVCLRELA